MKKLLIVVSFAFTLVLGSALLHSASAQCPMCKTSLEANRKDEGDQRVGNGINKGILYLLAMPFVMVGSVGGVYLYRIRRR